MNIQACIYTYILLRKQLSNIVNKCEKAKGIDEGTSPDF